MRYSTKVLLFTDSGAINLQILEDFPTACSSCHGKMQDNSRRQAARPYDGQSRTRGFSRRRQRERPGHPQSETGDSLSYVPNIISWLMLGTLTCGWGCELHGAVATRPLRAEELPRDWWPWAGSEQGKRKGPSPAVKWRGPLQASYVQVICNINLTTAERSRTT